MYYCIIIFAVTDKANRKRKRRKHQRPGEIERASDWVSFFFFSFLFFPHFLLKSQKSLIFWERKKKFTENKKCVFFFLFLASLTANISTFTLSFLAICPYPVLCDAYMHMLCMYVWWYGGCEISFCMGHGWWMLHGNGILILWEAWRVRKKIDKFTFIFSPVCRSVCLKLSVGPG